MARKPQITNAQVEVLWNVQVGIDTHSALVAYHLRPVTIRLCVERGWLQVTSNAEAWDRKYMLTEAARAVLDEVESRL